MPMGNPLKLKINFTILSVFVIFISRLRVLGTSYLNLDVCVCVYTFKRFEFIPSHKKKDVFTINIKFTHLCHRNICLN